MIQTKTNTDARNELELRSRGSSKVKGSQSPQLWRMECRSFPPQQLRFLSLSIQLLDFLRMGILSLHKEDPSLVLRLRYELHSPGKAGRPHELLARDEKVGVLARDDAALPKQEQDRRLLV